MKDHLLASTQLTGVRPKPPRATIDFETRSPVDIKKAGSWIYSLHPQTEVLCLSIRLPYWAPGRVELWHPAYPHLGIVEEGRAALQELFAWIAVGELVEAHNAFFEIGIWENICVPRLGWPAVPRSQWMCSAAKAATHCIPRDLLGGCVALDLPEKKDDVGKKVMLKLCKPRKPKKAERMAPGFDPDVLLWHESVEEFQQLWDYCAQDTLAEEALSEYLDDLSPTEQRVWQMDLDMNLRGVLVDRAMAEGALKIASEYCKQLDKEMRAITGWSYEEGADNTGAVENGRKRSQVVDWVKRQGVDLPNTQAATLEKFKAMKGLKERHPHVHRVLHITIEVNQTSTSKYLTAAIQASPFDDRARGQVMYHGAGTGRWSGKGLQPHNFKKGSLAYDPKKGIYDYEIACEIIREGDIASLQALFGRDSVMETLSGAIRGVLMASEGMSLMVADFAAIEARVVLWLARQMSALDVFEQGLCIYCDMATGLYGYQVVKGVHKDERQFGKQAILGLGFQMGFVTFLLTCAKYNIRFPEEMCRRIVGGEYAHHEEKVRAYFNGKLGGVRRKKVRDSILECEWEDVLHELVLMRYTTMKYRDRYPEVAEMWDEQEAAAIAAVQSPGRRVHCQRGRNTWVVEGRFLKCYLPGGRALHYCDPRVQTQKVPWSDTERKPVLTFMGVNSLTRQWERQKTYGGMLVENITQAVARDLMAEAMVRCDDNPDYQVLMSVHDELIAECPEGVGDVREFEQLMAAVPDWARGCPVDAEGWRGKRYRK